jgi:hypothetical protein
MNRKRKEKSKKKPETDARSFSCITSPPQNELSAVPRNVSTQPSMILYFIRNGSDLPPRPILFPTSGRTGVYKSLECVWLNIEAFSFFFLFFQEILGRFRFF